MKGLFKIIKSLEWGNNFFLPLLVIIVTGVCWLGIIKKGFSKIETQIRYKKREVSFAIFKNCIISEDFKDSEAFNKIKLIRRLRSKSAKAGDKKYFNRLRKQYFNKLMNKAYRDFTNTKLRRKIYKVWLKEYNKIREKKTKFYKYFSGELSYDEDIQFQKELGIIK